MAENRTPTEFGILEEFGLSRNEIRTYLTVLSMGLSDAKEICSQTGIPSSKIYNLLENLENYGLIEIQESRPKKYKPLSLDHALENLRKFKRSEYDRFKAKLPTLKSILQSRSSDFKSDAIFWNITLNEEEIFNRHISRFQFVEFVAMICIDYTTLEKITRGRMGQDISLNFKEKKITTKLIIGYDSEKEKGKILDWVHQRPREIDSKNQIRLLNERISTPFGLFDLNKVILIMRHPAKQKRFLLSIYMVNKSLYNDLSPLFDSIWQRGEDI